MNQSTPHVLLIEPYYGGSHRAFLIGLQKHLPFDFTLLCLPARKWKMRMQLAAPWMADEILKLIGQGKRFDAILCSTFIDVATLRVLMAQNGIQLPVAVYFHENQFAYPNQIDDSATYQFTALNFTTALASDTIAFNSYFNQETFIKGVSGYLKKATDMDISSKVEEIQEKSAVIYPGIDYENINTESNNNSENIPVIIWNHRWEHDKAPETFFHALMEFSKKGDNFKLIVLGQHFSRSPEIFERAEKELKNHIIHFGYAPDRNEYVRLMQRGNIVVSTAVHEFFGMSVLEAVRCGCRPLVPDRLSYRELFPEKFRYEQTNFENALSLLLRDVPRLEYKELLNLTDRYSWGNMAESYHEWLGNLL